MIRAVVALFVLVVALPAWAERNLDLAALGLTAEVRRFRSEPTLDLVVTGRTDEVAAGARLHLLLDPAAAKAPVRAIEVKVNDEPIATLRPRDRRLETIEIDANLLGDRNVIHLRLLPEEESPCGEVAPGTWAILQGGRLETWGMQLPLPNDLAVLPLPFYDRAFDRAAMVPMVLPERPDANLVRIAAILASGMGADSRMPLAFPVSLGALPESHAVVLVDGAAAARSLGLQAPEGPSVRMADHPGWPERAYKLLIVAGRTAEELELAVRRLSTSFGGLAGEHAFVGAAPLAGARLPWDAEGWASAAAPLRFDAIAKADRLALAAARGGTIALPFRLPPDLASWPEETIDLDIATTAVLREGAAPPRVDVELNGTRLGTLPAFPAAGGPVRTRLSVHRDLLRGGNELLVHVTPAAVPGACDAAAASAAEVRLHPDSTLHVETLRPFARLPDVDAFVHDGHPFTRLADLSETAIVVPEAASSQSLSTLLSIVARFGALTGVPGVRLAAVAAEDPPADLDKDLLLVGTPEMHPLLERWSARFPVVFDGPKLVVRNPAATPVLLSLLRGGDARRELARAQSTVATAVRPAAVMAAESPLARGRVALAVAAARPDDLPDAAALKGAGMRGADLLLIDGANTHSFRIGAGWYRGSLPVANRLQLFLAEYALVLVGMLIAGVIAFAWPIHTLLERRAARQSATWEPG